MRVTFPLQLKFADTGEPGSFEGLASTFGGEPDSYGDVVVPGAFSESLADHKAAGTRPAMLWSHALAEPIGTWTEIRESNVGLHVRGQLALDVAKAREAHALMKQGALALSIGYRVRPGGSYSSKGVNYLKSVDLHEISPVALAANRNARITHVKCDMSSIQMFEKSVRDELGLSARQAKRLLAGGWSALVRDESESTEDGLHAIALQLQTITKQFRNQK